MRLKHIVAMVMLALMAVAAEAAKIDVVINKASQKMTVSVDGRTKYVWLVSTGVSRYETPTGTYRPFRMEKDYFSKEWDNAPMPNAIFFTVRGHAVHGSYHTKRLGKRASHGCVRLAPGNAATLFSLVSKAGMRNTSFTVKRGFAFGFDGATLTPDEPKKPRKARKKGKKPLWFEQF